MAGYCYCGEAVICNERILERKSKAWAVYQKTRLYTHGGDNPSPTFHVILAYKGWEDLDDQAVSSILIWGSFC